MVPDNVRNAIRTGVLILKEAPEEEVATRAAVLAMIYELNEDWGRLAEEDLDWAFNLVYDARCAEEYENKQAALAEPKPVFGIIIFIMVVILGIVSAVFIK
jgi:hypothetical protein